MPTAFELVTAPASEPIDAATAKAHCRVTSSAEDVFFDRAIPAARRHLESTYGLALITQTHKGTLDAWPLKPLQLQPYPVSALNSVKVWDGSALTAQTLSGFQLIAGRPARVAIAVGGAAPAPARPYAGIEVEFVAGFGDAEDVPEEIIQAMLMLVAHWYENRETVIIGAKETKVSSEVTRGVDDLMFPYRAFRL